MSNPHRGETQVEIDGEVYTLVFSINALCEVEGLLGKPWGRIESDLMAGSLITVRAMFWGGLRERHPDLSLAEAGDLVTQAGVPALSDKLVEALKASFPKPEGDGGKKRPRKAKG